MVVIKVTITITSLIIRENNIMALLNIVPSSYIMLTSIFISPITSSSMADNIMETSFV